LAGGQPAVFVVARIPRRWPAAKNPQDALQGLSAVTVCLARRLARRRVPRNRPQDGAKVWNDEGGVGGR
jgi:hypothetical protein